MLNEKEQIRQQLFTPTKSLAHVQAELSAVTASLEACGHPQPILGYTDNVASDIQLFEAAIPSLATRVIHIDPDERDDLPLAKLPDNVEVIVSESKEQIELACRLLLDCTGDEQEPHTIYVGFDVEWDTHVGASGVPQRTGQPLALIQLAYGCRVYLLRVRDNAFIS